MISTTRRRILQSAGLGSPSGLRPYSASGAGRTARDAYDELGIRPVVNLQGTYTTWLAARPDGRRFPLPSYTPCNTATPGANQSHAARCGQYIGLYKPSFGVFSSFLRPEINPDEPSVFSQDSDCNRLGVLHAAQSAQFASVASEVEGIGWVFGDSCTVVTSRDRPGCRQYYCAPERRPSGHQGRLGGMLSQQWESPSTSQAPPGGVRVFARMAASASQYLLCESWARLGGSPHDLNLSCWMASSDSACRLGSVFRSVGECSIVGRNPI